MATAVSSAGGLLAMLNETHPLLKLHALSNLNNLVDNFWPEISTSVPVMYSLSLSIKFLFLIVLEIVFFVLVVLDLFVGWETLGSEENVHVFNFEICNAVLGF